jgi:hypothetical protein
VPLVRRWLPLSLLLLYRFLLYIYYTLLILLENNNFLWLFKLRTRATGALAGNSRSSDSVYWKWPSNFVTSRMMGDPDKVVHHCRVLFFFFFVDVFKSPGLFFHYFSILYSGAPLIIDLWYWNVKSRFSMEIGDYTASLDFDKIERCYYTESIFQ